MRPLPLAGVHARPFKWPLPLEPSDVQRLFLCGLCPVGSRPHPVPEMPLWFVLEGIQRRVCWFSLVVCPCPGVPVRPGCLSCLRIECVSSKLD